MPFFISLIIQRLLLFVYSILAFLGISPEIEIPTEEEAKVVIEERKNTIQDILDDTPDTDKVADALLDAIDDVEGSLDIPIDTSPSIELPTVDVPIDAVPEIAPIIETVTTIPETAQPSPVIVDNTTTISNVVVNTICTQKLGNAINVFTGSGVLISSEGVIITNAHVAQHFLLSDYNKNLIDCSVYKENLPAFGYKTDVLYISPDWIENNYQLINDPSPRGTGEDDYALLLITGNTNPALGLPLVYPYATPKISGEVSEDQSITAAGYPGSPAGIFDISGPGNLAVDLIQVEGVFTFGGGSIDIFSTTKSSVGARGSSGGGIFDNNGNDADLLGIITTTNGTSGNANINAITIPYINKDIDNGLTYYLSGNLSSKSSSFQDDYLEELSELLLEEF